MTKMNGIINKIKNKMRRIGAVAARINSKNRRKKRSPSEEETDLLKRKDHKDIEDIDIRENTSTRLKFRKLPWSEWALGAAFIAGALFLIFMMHYKNW